ncbi:MULTISPECIES: RDD family protein [Streptomyces]|uniref:RDD family protein n=1 Tax=Streptomyces caniscabiei TaxID=2746961 RepID=A0ABU4MRC0_9ACTN|nr:MULTISPECIES: RDD family protein [Streptomyces]MBE4740166.1 RDD family protein [Streptomyces caniscabiei]MBE4759056.1 RDD family protein [Streptomyces caniscabiei]MBE4772926.1 RDD family protein [Streptomyces caniscabiei]MBE4788186.1 RDD family protein [Streptomyces caniscabiei]MBE4797425.1 RDD family protein [Streptomyces caniscabiei]
MSTEPPPSGSGQSPDDDPFRKQPPPYGSQPPPGGQPPPYSGGPYGGGAYGGDPYGGGRYPNDPLSGMPPLADSGKRVLARIIDMILVGIVVGLLAWAFRISQYTVDSDDFEFGKSFAQEALAAVLYIAYDTYFSVKNGQTLGKRLLKLRVANLNDGSTPSVQTALIRAAVLWIPFAFCCACIWTAIAGGWSFFDKPYKQGLHDKAAKTVVVSTA